MLKGKRRWVSQLQRAPILLFCSFQVLNRLSCALERVDDFYFSFLISVILSSKAPAQAHSNTVLREVNGLFKILDNIHESESPQLLTGQTGRRIPGGRNEPEEAVI